MMIFMQSNVLMISNANMYHNCKFELWRQCSSNFSLLENLRNFSKKKKNSAFIEDYSNESAEDFLQTINLQRNYDKIGHCRFFFYLFFFKNLNEKLCGSLVQNIALYYRFMECQYRRRINGERCFSNGITMESRCVLKDINL